MKTVKLHDGNSIPQLGLGTWQLTGKDCEAAVLHALKSGYRHIDTAHIYGNEREIGSAIRKSGIHRDELFITTKIWNTQHDDPQDALEISLKKLDLDKVDLFLIHWPVPERNETWKTMQRLKKDGLCSSIGVSNFTIGHLKQLKGEKPVVDQVEFNPFLYQKDLLGHCKKAGITVEAYCPLSRGSALGDAKLCGIANKYSRSPAQTMLRWGVQHGVIVIPKSKTPARIEENMRVFDFKINGADMKTLDGLDRNLRTCWDPTGIP
ncbi:MAG TPA: aldo/keto reductase [archaeon]|nr:aldo/keto reductase [archaeon]